MKISRLQIEVPDNCPTDCRAKGQFEQGGLCHRCPVFNCRPIQLTEAEHKEISGPDAKGPCTFSALEAIDYRDDWAIEWSKFFKGEIGYPVLCLRKSVDNEYESHGIQGDVPDLRK